MSNTTPLLKDPEAARRLGLATGTLRNMRSQRRGPRFVRIGSRAVRYRLEDLDAWIEGQLVTP